jgi:hypothetical protein
MKSIHHGTAGANAKLRGKREHLLSCGCCVLRNFSDNERWKEAKQEIETYASDDDWFYPYEYVDEIQGE